MLTCPVSVRNLVHVERQNLSSTLSLIPLRELQRPGFPFSCALRSKRRSSSISTASADAPKWLLFIRSAYNATHGQKSDVHHGGSALCGKGNERLAAVQNLAGVACPRFL